MIRGFPVEQDPAVYTTRWRFIRGIPLVVRSPGRSLVGSLTLTSATPLKECLLTAAAKRGKKSAAVIKQKRAS
jgi:hypothetical protein